MIFIRFLLKICIVQSKKLKNFLLNCNINLLFIFMQIKEVG